MTAQILVVDDEPDFCSNLADILGDMGYGIDVAYRGAEAIDRAKRQHFDLFLLDYKLPCMTGAELYKRLKEAGATTPALIVTAFTSHETTENAKSAGVATVLQKPVDFDELISVIKQQVGAVE